MAYGRLIYLNDGATKLLITSHSGVAVFDIFERSSCNRFEVVVHTCFDNDLKFNGTMVFMLNKLIPIGMVDVR